MIANIPSILAAPRSARIVRATLSARRIATALAEVRDQLDARTLHTEVRQRDRASRVFWSLWIGRFEKAISWLLAERFKETRYAFLLILEYEGFVGVVGSNVGDVGNLIG